MPGIQSAALTTCSPLTNEGGSSWFLREARPTAHPEELIANNRLVSEDYFRMLGIPLREGRTFSGHDGAEAPLVAVINESMARRFWPGESPVGKRFQFISKPWVQIIGVVGDVHQTALDFDPAPNHSGPGNGSMTAAHIRAPVVKKSTCSRAWTASLRIAAS